MNFDFKDPLEGLPPLKTDICDSHVHIWDADAFSDLEKWGHMFGVKRFMGIAQPDVKKTLEQNGKASDIVFAYYLPMQAFAEKKPERIVEAVDEAHSLNYSLTKTWFGPRQIDFYNTEKLVSIADPIFEPVFSRIEDYGLPLDIHVADPDIWYSTKYQDSERYRTKTQAINEFNEVLERHPSLKVISVHFGSLPEIHNLIKLEEIFKKFTNFYIDTASTKWIVRELGKDPQQARDFIIRNQDRILFATDLSVGWADRSEKYFPTRYWAQRIFWETNVRKVKLPFSDEDNLNPPTFINGLNLPQSVLDRFYWQNAEKFFK
ncbi:MAG: amidohydrolase family protein [Candidatus Heimdallarchaeota archaeon]|nr:MAG: amidohydrolase family protein [Candidatus Heimdallarchaeota archaeon]